MLYNAHVLSAGVANLYSQRCHVLQRCMSCHRAVMYVGDSPAGRLQPRRGWHTMPQPSGKGAESEIHHFMSLAVSWNLGLWQAIADMDDMVQRRGIPAVTYLCHNWLWPSAYPAVTYLCHNWLWPSAYPAYRGVPPRASMRRAGVIMVWAGCNNRVGCRVMAVGHRQRPARFRFARRHPSS